ncbi:Helix-turn-helix domain-containing protein [Actinopolyspora alba]|uniref:Helix-turn-helix domain-containing protein n=1 Tax=Actinopolyspora alba TaxID=673379 RepID=A0A1I1ZN11_9ACTN|nr:helix-turn-helix transcriptional regulator [Actinopolyspora alba]SFE33071.1 Helix-turn-helix domain-containing protein [Actinopolyspora alba]
MGDAPLTMASWALGARLRTYRTNNDLTTEFVAKRLGVRQPTVSRIEKGKHRLTTRQLASLCELYGLSGEVATKLEEARSVAGRPDWRQDYQQLLDGPFGDVLGLETGASRIRALDGQLVFGLLQTEEYATALMREAPYIRATEVKRRVALRMQRQSGVHNGDQEFVGVLGEAALRQHVGGREVMRRQLDQLREMAERDNVLLRLLPYEAGAHAAFGSAFTVLDFRSDDITLPTVVCVDTLTSALIYEGERVETYTSSFDMMMPKSLDEQETVERLERIRDDW